MKKRKKTLIILNIIFMLNLLLIPTLQTKSLIPDPVIYVNFLTPNTSTNRMQWSLLIEQEVAKIGINVSFNDITGWGEIAPRTWSYPLIDYDYIPTYADGGYDLLFTGWTWPLDLNLQGLYDTASIVPMGDNYYQYSKPAYDSIYNDFIIEYDNISRKDYAYMLEAILYEDLPAIPIIYAADIYGEKIGLTGINETLIGTLNYLAEYWDDPDDHIIKYAIPADLTYYNIFLNEAFFDGLWMQAVYGSLFERRNKDFLWVPQIARNYSIVEIDNKLNITIDIDPNAKFSDGSQVLAEDVKYSYDLYMNPSVGSHEYGLLMYWFGSSSAIEVVDTDTIRFQLQHIYNYPLRLLSYEIIDKSTVEPLISTYGYSIFTQVPGTGNVGWALVTSCGPFMVDTYDNINSVVKLVPNPYWLGESVSLNELYFVFIAGKNNALAELILGNIDIIDSNYYPLLADFDGYSTILPVISSSLRSQEISVNMKHPILGTGELTPLGTVEAAKLIRKAISHVIPRQNITEDILEGIGFPGILAIPESCVDFDKTLEPYEYNLDLARNYIITAGYVDLITEFNQAIFLVFLLFSIVIIPIKLKIKKKK